MNRCVSYEINIFINVDNKMQVVESQANKLSNKSKAI